MQSIELVKKRLSLFGNPAVFLFKEKGKGSNGNIDFTKYYSLEEAITINEKCPLGLAFSPNGLLGEKNIIGEKVNHKKDDAKNFVAALFIDLDLDKSSYTNKKDYLNYIKDKIENLKIRISYLVETQQGFHAYIFIDEQHRYEVGEELKGSKFKEIETAISELFDGGDDSSMAFNKLMRLPFSTYWKNYPMNEGDFKCKLYKVKREDEKVFIEEVTKPEQISFDGIIKLNLGGIKNYKSNIKDLKKNSFDISSPTSNPKDKANFNETCEEVNRLPITEVIEKLSKYPREYNGNRYVFHVYGGTHIGFYINDNTELVKTDGYIINKNRNYVHCFSDCYHPIEERPQGNVYPFIHHYFKSDRKQINQFLKDEYGITFNSSNIGEPISTIETTNGTFNFQDNGVRFNNGKIRQIFPSPFIIKGFCETKFRNGGETETENANYLIKLLTDNKELTIKPFFDKRKFNNAYGGLGLITKASDNELADFRNCLRCEAKNGGIPTYDYIYLNGYHKKFFVIGDKAYNHNAEEINPEDRKVILATQPIERYKTSEDVSIKEFGNKFKELFTDRESMLMFVSFISLLIGHNFRVPNLKDVLTQVLVPGIFLSGRTKSGKTTAISIIEHGFELSDDNKKKFSVNSVTPQPLRQAGSDSRILHLEERTGNYIKEEKETIVRDIINKTVSAKGDINSNVYYMYKAGVIIDGETSPKSDSVVNRCIYIPFFVEDMRGDVGLLRSFSKLSCLKDFIRKLYQIDERTIGDTYQSKQELLLELGLTDRIANNYAYLLCINEWFDIYSEDELLNAIIENMDLQRTIGEKKAELNSILSDSLIKDKVPATRIKIDDHTEKYSLQLSNDTIQKCKVNIIGAIRKYGNDKICTDTNTNNMIITYDSCDCSDKNKELYNIISPYESCFCHKDNSDCYCN